MRNKITITLMSWCMLTLLGCTTTDDVLFVTKTSIGIDFDSKPATANIGYDRTEGYIAPRYANGEIPPVVASIKSDGGIFSPKIRQVYATGDAAVIAVSQDPKTALEVLDPDPDTSDKEQEKTLQGEKQLMFFGTTTTTGLKVGFTTYVPDSFSFGFKRKEYSFIPLGTVGTGDNAYDVYPSVLASIDTDANAGTASETGTPSGDTSLKNSQFFATGRAARKLAANDVVSDAFKDAAKRGLASGLSQSEAAKALRAYANDLGISEEEKDKRFIAIEQTYTSLKGPDADLVIGSFIRDTNPDVEFWQARVAKELKLIP